MVCFVEVGMIDFENKVRPATSEISSRHSETGLIPDSMVRIAFAGLG